MSEEYGVAITGLILMVAVFLWNYRRIRLAWINPEKLKKQQLARVKGDSWFSANNRNYYGSDGFIWVIRVQSLIILLLGLFFMVTSITAIMF
jgi:hypothetical protein